MTSFFKDAETRFANFTSWTPKFAQDIFDDFYKKVTADIHELMKPFMPENNLQGLITVILFPLFVVVALPMLLIMAPWLCLKNITPQLILAGTVKIALQIIILPSLFLIMHPISTAAVLVTFPSRAVGLVRQLWLLESNEDERGKLF